MDKIINLLLHNLVLHKCISEDDCDVFYFGLECSILKVLHYISYIVIGFMTNSIVSLLISASVMIPLRKNGGGYHANTRTWCYLFSCMYVILTCVINKVFFSMIIYIIVLLLCNVVIFVVAPVENKNRNLSREEVDYFKRKIIIILILSDLVISIMFFLENKLYVYLVNGIFMVTLLMVLGKFIIERVN